MRTRRERRGSTKGALSRTDAARVRDGTIWSGIGDEECESETDWAKIRWESTLRWLLGTRRVHDERVQRYEKGQWLHDDRRDPFPLEQYFACSRPAPSGGWASGRPRKVQNHRRLRLGQARTPRRSGWLNGEQGEGGALEASLDNPLSWRTGRPGGSVMRGLVPRWWWLRLHVEQRRGLPGAGNRLWRLRILE